MGLLRRARSVRGRTQPRRLNYHCTYGHAYDSVPLLACGPCLGRGMRGVCAVSSDEGPCARHASRALRRACGQGAVLSLCMVRPGSGRFGVGFWVGFWVGLRARDFPTERVLSRTPLIIRTAGGSKSFVFVWFGLVWVGLGWDSGWDSGWDCARGIFPPRESALPDPLNFLFRGNWQIPGLAAGAVGHSLFYSLRWRISCLTAEL